MIARIDEARRAGDSLGGVVECVCRNVPPGLGEPVFDKLEADLARGVMSLPASKGFEIGSGFAGTPLTGIEHNDPFTTDASGRVRTAQQPLRRRARRHQQRRGHRLPRRLQADGDDLARRSRPSTAAARR